MKDQRQLLIGTGNPGKAHEMRALFADTPVELVTLTDLGLQLSVPETGGSYQANASHKALVYAQAADLWTLADDTGLEVSALNGAPGLYSARLAGPGASDADRRRRLLSMLAPYPRPWIARFHCTLVLASPKAVIATTDGDCPGQIIPQAHGKGGFGYDPIFLVDGEERTMAELSEAQKNRISHRGRAAAAMVAILRQELSAH
ncbi:MAG: RdgB/HAM1 family non-canonical purine NTP pyrophosphatase [Anaerolineales bacterium]